MNMPEAEETDPIASGLAAVRAAGGRATATKRLLLEIMAADTTHRTADELTAHVQAESADVASSTIYRILEELERIGMVEHSHAGKGPATFHLRAAAHGHLVCQICGSMTEADPAIFEQLVAAAADHYGFAVDPHHFAVLGECSNCRDAAS
jgi:Fur family ferric uptake transcriptional regulator